MFRSSFEKTLETATSHLRLEPDWPSILLICDEINQKDVTPEKAFGAIKKKMNSQNPHSAYYALLVLECVVKNCGTPIHDEVFTKENCEMFSSLIESTPHENVRDKIIELIQTWAFAFRSSEKYQAIKDTLNIVKTRGYTFPELKETDAMFTADTAPNWADGKVCHRCRVEFTFTNRKHHCRNCGQVFCGQCTAKQCALPKYGIEREVRVCDGCYAALQKPASKVNARPSDSDLPAEYLNSSLSQQVQTPPRKSDQELKEEEELQLALALSQSEAEQQKQKQQSLTNSTYRMQQPRSPSPEAPPTAKEYSQQEESNPDLAKYLNRSYWEQRKVSDSSIASPSAPSPMPATPQPQQMQPKMPDEIQIDEFAANMRTQVDIFVNRMKSNSSRGRSIANDSSVQTLFLTLTSLHSQQLAYIKELDDKRMWYEQLQDKLVQIKDSRAALDVLRQEHVEKLRRIAEEQERQRQIQMAQKLEIMRKKKQEYLQYQRQLALQKIQEQEREMQLRQEQQKAQYLMGQTTAFPYIPGAPAAPGLSAGHTSSPSHQLNNVYNPYAFNPNSSPLNASGQFNMPPHGATIPPGMYGPAAGMPQPANPLGNLDSSQQMGASMPHFPPGTILPPGMLPNGPMLPPGVPQPNQQPLPGQIPQMPDHVPPNMQSQTGVPTSVAPTTQQQQQHPSQLTHVMLQQAHVLQNQPPIPNVSAPPPTVMQTQAQIHHQQLAAVQQHPIPVQHQPHPQPQPQPQPQQQPQPHPHPQQQPQAQPQQQMTPLPNNVAAGDSQIQAVSSAPPPPQNEPEPATAPSAPSEPATAELISFD